MSRFCWGAKGSRKRGVRAVFGHQNFEQPHGVYGVGTDFSVEQGRFSGALLLLLGSLRLQLPPRLLESRWFSWFLDFLWAPIELIELQRRVLWNLGAAACHKYCLGCDGAARCSEVPWQILSVTLCPCRTTQPGRQSVDAWVLQVRIFWVQHVRTVHVLKI